MCAALMCNKKLILIGHLDNSKPCYVIFLYNILILFYQTVKLDLSNLNRMVKSFWDIFDSSNSITIFSINRMPSNTCTVFWKSPHQEVLSAMPFCCISHLRSIVSKLRNQPKMFIKHLFDARNSILYSDHLLSLHVSSVAIQNQYDIIYTIEIIFIHLVSTFLSQFVKSSCVPIWKTISLFLFFVRMLIWELKNMWLHHVYHVMKGTK